MLIPTCRDCCLFEGVDSRFRGNDRRQVLKDAKLQLKPPKKSTYNRDGHSPTNTA